MVAEKDGDELIIELQDEVDATEYSIGYSIPDNEAILRFHNEKGVLSNFVTNAAGVYELAQRLLRAYDKLEGI